MRIAIHGKEIQVADTAQVAWWVNVENGTWEPYTYDIFDRFLTPETTYFDVGAWIGPTVLYAAHTCKQCYAFEPDPRAYSDLIANVNANSFLNIQTFNEAVMDYDGKVVLGNDHNLGDSGTRLRQVTNQFWVPCHTLNTLVSNLNASSPLFIKMDVEGAEEFIFKSVDFFQEWKPTIYVSLHKTFFADEKLAMETIRKVGRLYKHCYDVYLNEVSVEDNYGGFVFTD